MTEQEAGSSKSGESNKNPRTYFLIGYAFLVAMALVWSLDSSLVYIFFGIGCFFIFLGFYSRRGAVEPPNPRTYRAQGQRAYSSSTESLEDKIKEFFQRKPSASRAQPPDALAKGRKIALAVGIGIFVMFTIPFVVAFFGSDDVAESRYHFMSAQEHFEAQRYDSAYIEYKRALALDPEYTEAMVGYGQMLVIRNEKDSAVRMFDRALSINPAYGEATYNKARVWYDQKKYNDGINILTPLLAEQPQYYQAMLALGDCYYALDKFDDALPWYENAYQNGGMSNFNLCYIMGYLYERRQDNARAIQLYQEALTYDDTVADIYQRLGQLIPGEDGNAYRVKAIELKR